MNKVALVRSRSEGESAWIPTRGVSRLSISGLAEGDRVEVDLFPSRKRLEFHANGVHSCINGAEAVKVYHAGLKAESCVTVALEA